jgi:hypothetical protein
MHVQLHSHVVVDGLVGVLGSQATCRRPVLPAHSSLHSSNALGHRGDVIGGADPRSALDQSMAGRLKIPVGVPSP